MPRSIKLVSSSAQTAPASASSAVEPTMYAPEGVAVRELAYNEIKRRVMACEFRPGEPLNEAQLDILLGLDHTLTHQALHQLEVEELMQILPRKGILMTPLSLNDVLDVIEVRITNEILYATLAAECAHPADFDAMRAIVDVPPALVEHRNTATPAALDFKLHLAISTASRSRALTKLLHGLYEKQAHFQFLSLSKPQHLRDVYDEHLVVLDVLERHDMPVAREAVHEHIDELYHTVIRTF